MVQIKHKKHKKLITCNCGSSRGIGGLIKTIKLFFEYS